MPSHIATLDNRPSTEIPLDDSHAFLNDWLDPADPIYVGWKQHFERTGCLFRESENIHGKKMLFVHHVSPAQRKGENVPVWCCS